MKGIEEIKSNIVKWITDDSESKYNISEVENTTNEPNFPYLLKVDTGERGKSLLPGVFLFKPLQYADKIGIYSGINFNETQKESFDGLNEQAKKSIATEILNGISLMNLIITLHPHKLDIKSIHFQELIYFDGITKDRIMNSITKVFNAYVYIFTVLEKYNIIRPQFDSSKFT